MKIYQIERDLTGIILGQTDANPVILSTLLFGTIEYIKELEERIKKLEEKDVK